MGWAQHLPAFEAFAPRFNAMRAHAKRLRDAVDSVSDAQQVLSKKISRYADKIDGTQRKLDNLRSLPVKTPFAVSTSAKPCRTLMRSGRPTWC